MVERRCGFTLIELLVVVAIIAVLAALLFPVFAEAKATSRAAICLQHLKHFGAAFAMYQTDWDGSFPYTALPGNPGNDLSGGPCSDNVDSGSGMWYRRWDELWIVKLETYVRYPLVRRGQAAGSPAQGIMQCKGMDAKVWKVSLLKGVPDDVGYGYNFLYLGLPFKPYADTPPLPDDASLNPHVQGGFRWGAAKAPAIKDPAETICLVENAFIWAFAPYWESGRRQISGNAYVRPRHARRTKSNVLWADGHASSMETKYLVHPRLEFGDGNSVKPPQRGVARSNALWDLK